MCIFTGRNTEEEPPFFVTVDVSYFPFIWRKREKKNCWITIIKCLFVWACKRTPLGIISIRVSTSSSSAASLVSILLPQKYLTQKDCICNVLSYTYSCDSDLELLTQVLIHFYSIYPARFL